MLSLFRPRLTPRLLTLRPTTRYLTNKPGPTPDETASESKIQSKNEVKPRSTQNTSSSTNQQIGSDNSSYNPHTTNPVDEKSEVGKESFDDSLGGIQEHRPSSGPDNPLEYSGATPEVSAQKEDRGHVTKHGKRQPSHGTKSV